MAFVVIQGHYQCHCSMEHMRSISY